MNPERWRESGSWLSGNGGRVFIQAIGHGMPVITLHAFPTSSYDFSRIASYLAEQYHVILFDYVGYGYSDKPHSHQYSLFDNVSALVRVADHFGIKRAYVLAHDIGDSVALIALAQQALVIDKLVLINGSVVSMPFEKPVMRLVQRLLLDPTLGPLTSKTGLINRAFFALTTRQLFSYPLPPEEIDAFWSIITYNRGARLYPILMRYMVERWQYQYQWLAALQNDRAPLTLIWGQRDPIATPAVAAAVLALRPDARYVQLDHVGHYPHWEAPDQVAEAIKHAFD